VREGSDARPGGRGAAAVSRLSARDRDPWELVLDLGCSRVVGGSVAALATAFAIEPLGVAVDIGRCSAVLAAQPTVLLTHCHADHVAGLIAWLSARARRFRGAGCRVAVPAGSRAALLEALTRWPDLDGVRRRLDLSEVLVPAQAGERLHLDSGAWAEPFAVHHGVPSLGWRVGRAGERRPLVAFAGDGTVLPFRDDPGLLDAQAAVVECSFVEPGFRVAARLGGHAHLADWLELAPRLTCDRLVLAHLPPDLDPARLETLVAEAGGQGPPLVAWAAG